MLDHANRAHARYAPSGDHWWLCPGSARLCDTLPAVPESPWAAEGRRAHELLQTCLQEHEIDAKFYLGVPMTDFVVTEVQCESVQYVLDYVYGILGDYPDAELYLERYLPVPQNIVPVSNCGGTSDICIYIPSIFRLIVVDFKHGSGVSVDHRENKQIKMYALAANATFPEPIREIELTIIQPRAWHIDGPIRTETIDIGELIVSFAMELDEHLAACEADDAPLIPGEKQCRFCPAKRLMACPALEQRALSIFGANVKGISDLSSATLPEAASLSAQQLSNLLAVKKAVLGYFEEAERTASHLAATGVYIPGYKLVLAQARRKWFGEPADVAEKYRALTGCALDTIFPRQLITITDAESLLKRNARERAEGGRKREASRVATEAMSFLTEKVSSGKYTLVKEDDRRPAINPTAVQLAGVDLPQLEIEHGDD